MAPFGRSINLSLFVPRLFYSMALNHSAMSDPVLKFHANYFLLFCIPRHCSNAAEHDLRGDLKERNDFREASKSVKRESVDKQKFRYPV